MRLPDRAEARQVVSIWLTGFTTTAIAALLGLGGVVAVTYACGPNESPSEHCRGAGRAALFVLWGIAGLAPLGGTIASLLTSRWLPLAIGSAAAVAALLTMLFVYS